MQKWEYITQEKGLIGAKDEYEFLREMGKKGWELVSVYLVYPRSRYYFKRPLPPETTATKIFNEVEKEVDDHKPFYRPGSVDV